MHPPMELTDEQRDLLVELLRREHRELATEIHHTDSRSLRHQLHERREMVSEMLEVMHAPLMA